MPEIDAELMQIGPCVLDGEMCALDDHAAGELQGPERR